MAGPSLPGPPFSVRSCQRNRLVNERINGIHAEQKTCELVGVRFLHLPQHESGQLRRLRIVDWLHSTIELLTKMRKFVGNPLHKRLVTGSAGKEPLNSVVVVLLGVIREWKSEEEVGFQKLAKVVSKVIEALGKQWHKTIAHFTCLAVANKVD